MPDKTKKIGLTCEKERHEDVFLVREKDGTRSARIFIKNDKFEGCTFRGLAAQYTL